MPPFGSGATLYVRPLMIATGDVIGVKPADEYQFRILVTPVGPYFKGGDTAVKLCVSKYDRAAPHGTGNIKAGLNYAMSLKAGMEAHAAGYAENLYLDSESRTYVEETGGANVLFVAKDGTLVVPKSHTDSILPSITRRSLVQVAQDLEIAVDERPVTWDEVASGAFVECGLCGTADATVVLKMKSLTAIMSEFTGKFQEYLTTIDPQTVESEEALYKEAGAMLMKAVKNAEPEESECVFTYEKDDENTWSATDSAEQQILEAMM